jgi:hypothetical protein
MTTLASETTTYVALKAAKVTATAVSTGAILGFFALLLGAIAAWFGGAAGTKAMPLTTINETRRV